VKIADIDVETIKRFLSYNAETGKLFWNARVASDFPVSANMTSAQRCAAWNTRFAGKEAFTAKDADGYHVGSVGGKLLKAHRVIWCLVHGTQPPHGIDHWDGQTGHNNMSNLRPADQSKNMKNASMRSDNSSGLMGVVWDKARQKWVVRVNIDKRPKYVGRFSDFDQAAAARISAQRKADYSINHGREKLA